MTIFRALKRNLMTQGWKPVPSMVEFYKKLGMNNHGGFDWSAETGDPLYFDCSTKGFVLNTEIDNNGGLGINIITEDESGIFKHRYWHLKSFNVVAGQWVESGDLIGYADNTGLSTGTHLHRDAKEMIKENGIYKIKYPNNGTYGTIDYSPMFKNIFILDYLDIQLKQISILQKLINLWQQLLKGRVK